MDGLPEEPADPRASVWQWTGGSGAARVSFSGRGTTGSRQEVFADLTGDSRPLAWAHQVHSARVLRGRPGECGDGDALIGRDPSVALGVVTADCVPLLLAGPVGIAAVHAGWRGIVSGVVAAAVAELGGAPGELEAWIGPAIGSCCYEVGPEVASQLAQASDPSLVTSGPAGRPHVDLPGAVRRQLENAGVRRVELLALCTRCQATRLHSYRRDGRASGRNHAFIWLQ
jgi:polyphenol oxidase